MSTSLTAFSESIWKLKYQFSDPDGTPVDNSIQDSWRRVARALASVERENMRSHWESRFYDAMEGFKFLPAGRIFAGAGTGRDVTLFNCFVMGTIPDDMSGIFTHLREAALTLQQGGGIGYDFSTLRPAGALVAGVGADASGPVSFMDVWDSMCRTIMSAGSRRGAMMATLRCDHPDIENFILAKREAERLTNFNLSVLVTDAFMHAVDEGADWDLTFDGKVYKTVSAQDLWDQIMRATYDAAEPGVIFIDRINQRNNLSYCENINATNPCGEQPLPPYGACLLGSINLSALIKEPFTDKAELDLNELARLTATAVRMMDNVTDVSRFPLPEQKAEAEAKRRIGLGVTGLADAFVMCGIRYGSDASVTMTETWLKALRDAAYRASVDLAGEKGSFPAFDRDAYVKTAHIQELDADLIQDIARYGIRNALLTSIAPTGTISLTANNISSGIEPIFAMEQARKVLMPDGSHRTDRILNNAWRLYQKEKGLDAAPPDCFVDIQGLTPDDHLRIQAAAQKYIDSSISKTINLPADISYEDFVGVYRRAFETGCKGATTYRPTALRGSVLDAAPADGTRQEDGVAEPMEPVAAKARVGLVQDDIFYMTEPLERPTALPGSTYKLKWPESDHAIYITVNDIEQDGRKRPFEVFINSKNMEHYAWTVALTRMISAVFRRGGDVSFVVEELKAVFDPRGGYWMGGRYVPSLLAAIGSVIERHMVSIGFLEEVSESTGKQGPPGMTIDLADEDEVPDPLRDVVGASHKQCPQCGTPGVVHQEGCDTCLNCGWSRCG